jgi:hypothetical protein
MAISNWIIIWDDNEGSHIRLIKGTATEIDEGKELIRRAYGDKGIKNFRVMISDGNFGSIEVLREEAVEAAKNFN